ENLLKAEVVRRIAGAVAGGRLGEELTERPHQLVPLAERAGWLPALSAAERAMLALASDACISWGRYPGGVAHNRGDIGPPDGFDVRDFRETYEDLFGRIDRTV